MANPLESPRATARAGQKQEKPFLVPGDRMYEALHFEAAAGTESGPAEVHSKPRL